LELPQLLLAQIEPEHLPYACSKLVSAKKIGQTGQIGFRLRVPGPEILLELRILAPLVGIVFRGIGRIGNLIAR
jgi:hypothetical protein